MINKYFEVGAPRADAMHAEPIAALDALKLASLEMRASAADSANMPMPEPVVSSSLPMS